MLDGTAGTTERGWPQGCWARPRGSPEAAQLSRLIVLPERSRDIEES